MVKITNPFMNSCLVMAKGLEYIKMVCKYMIKNLPKYNIKS